jgi:hypothetical protein
MREGAEVSAGTFGSGDGGQLLVEADRVFLSGDGGATIFTDITSQEAPGITSLAGSGSSGDAGDLTVRAGSLEVRGGAVVSVSTFGRGDGGQLSVEADRVFLSGDGARHHFSSGVRQQWGCGGFDSDRRQSGGAQRGVN